MFDARHFLQPLHADADVDDRMFEQELVLHSAIAGVPAKEAETLPREIGGDIMFREIDVIVRGDDRDLGPLARLGPIDALARVAARLNSRRGRRRTADECRVEVLDAIGIHLYLSCFQLF